MAVQERSAFGQLCFASISSKAAGAARKFRINREIGSLKYQRSHINLEKTGVWPYNGELQEKNTRMSTPMEKATAYLSKLKADRAAAKAVSKKKHWRLWLSKHGSKVLEKQWKYLE